MLLLLLLLLQDGFPRTIAQADAFMEREQLDLVVNLTLPDEALVTKLLGRRVCDHCGRNFNVANIQDGELDMPPLLPPEDCETCHGDPKMHMRDDDTEEIVTDRLKTYHSVTAPLVKYYDDRGVLIHFPVKKGLADLPKLVADMEAHARASK